MTRVAWSPSKETGRVRLISPGQGGGSSRSVCSLRRRRHTLDHRQVGGRMFPGRG